MRYCAVYKNYNSLLHNLGVTVFVIFHISILLGSFHKNYKRSKHQALSVDRSLCEKVQYTRTIVILLHNLGVIAFCYVSYY